MFLFFILLSQVLYVSSQKFGIRSKGAIIGNSKVILGINDAGSLNIPYIGGVLGLPPKDPTNIKWVGLRTGDGKFAATEAGARSEGWGVAVRLSGSSKLQYPTSANQNYGFKNMLPVNFIGKNGGTRAVSVVKQSTNKYTVKHDCQIAGELKNMFKCVVTITNTYSADFLNVHYRRTMDWDISPTPFKERVTIQGWGSSKFLFKSATNGFIDDSPLIPLPANANNNKNVKNVGPADLGALLEFRFPILKKGNSLKFNIYYGVSPGEVKALKSLASIGAEAYSLGKPKTSLAGLPYTFFFGFTGVGGKPILPTIKPLPTTPKPIPSKPVEGCVNFIDFPSNVCIDDKYLHKVEKIKVSGDPILYNYICPKTPVCASFKCKKTLKKVSRVVFTKTFNAKYLVDIAFILSYHQYKYLNKLLGKSIGKFSVSCDNEKTWKILKKFEKCDGGIYEDLRLPVDNIKCNKNDNIIFKYELECYNGDIDFSTIGKLCIDGTLVKVENENEIQDEIIDYNIDDDEQQYDDDDDDEINMDDEIQYNEQQIEDEDDFDNIVDEQTKRNDFGVGNIVDEQTKRNDFGNIVDEQTKRNGFDNIVDEQTKRK